MENLDPVSLYFKEIRKTPPLNHKEFLRFWKIFKSGEDARDELERLKNVPKEQKRRLEYQRRRLDLRFKKTVARKNALETEKIRLRKLKGISKKTKKQLWTQKKDLRGEFSRLETQKKNLNFKSEKELHQLIRQGGEAKLALVIGNLRLVIPIAKRFYRSGLDFLDLVEEGNIGLIHALKKFNARKGFRFSTYASYWIDQAVRRSIEEQSKTIRIPPHAWEALRKWFREWENLTGQLGRRPTLSEMAHKLNLTARQVKGVVEAVEASRGIGSIDLALDEDENLALKDIISDEEKREPDKLFSVLKLHDEMESALSKLPKREKEIVMMRFGLDGGESATLEDVGQKLKISRERVRQIQERAVSRLKQIAQKMGLG